MIDIAVIGGGAAGFFAAIKAAEENPRAHVVIYEKGLNLLTKVKVSGGGRCNVTHACFEPRKLVTHYPRGGQALLGPFHKFQPADTVTWFESRGVPLKTEDDGRMFPSTDTSATIIDALKNAAANAGVTIRVQTAPTAVVAEAPRRFRLEFSSGDPIHCDRVLLATGNSEQAWGWARAMGHTVEAPVPSLFTFTIPDARLKGLAGLSVEKAEVSVVGTDLLQRGPLLITHWGLSGPAVLKLSAWGARVLHDRGYEADILVNWTGLTSAEVLERLRAYKAANPRKRVSVHSPLPVPHRLWERLALATRMPLEQCWADLSNLQMGRLVETLCGGIYPMRGKSTFKEEFVTCGGIRLDEIDFRSMESRLCPGLYFAGEAIDVDGVTGGFNFQNAWTTGWLAGRAMSAPGSPVA